MTRARVIFGPIIIAAVATEIALEFPITSHVVPAFAGGRLNARSRF